MIQLNLPTQQLKIKDDNGIIKIYDSLRSKYLVLTPEEWVRQNFVSFLISEKHFPASLMSNEIALKFNKMTRRCDTVVFNKKGEPFVIIEYKAPNIKISQQVFDQIVRYNMVLKADYLMVSNGLQHYCCKIDYINNSYQFLKDLPDYSEL